MSTGLLTKVLRSLVDFPKAFVTPSHPKLIMTLLVKNEGDVLEENILFHKTMGVDAFIITDNNSTDNTKDIISKYREKGWVVDVIEETATDYEQKQWVDRMILLARNRHQADWVVNADADELWYSPSGNIKNELLHTSSNVLRCTVQSVYPEENLPFWQWNEIIRPVMEQEKYGLSIYSIFERQNKKVIHRTDGYIQISMGNHKVAMFPKRVSDSDIRVYHYNVRGKAHFMAKMINGGRQLEQHKSKHGGRHWRYFYELYKEGRLEEEYRKVIGQDCIEALRADGYVVEDNTIPSIFSKINPDCSGKV